MQSHRNGRRSSKGRPASRSLSVLMSALRPAMQLPLRRRRRTSRSSFSTRFKWTASFSTCSLVNFTFASRNELIVLISLFLHFEAPNEGLASFGIHFLSLKGHKLVDESMSASVVLCDVQLDDIRPGRQNLITKYFQWRPPRFS